MYYAESSSSKGNVPTDHEHIASNGLSVYVCVCVWCVVCFV